MKTLATLIADIDKVFAAEHKMSDKNLDDFCNNIKVLIKKRIEDGHEKRDNTLRMSKLGKKDRQLYYDINHPVEEVLSTSNQIKFMYGDIIEQVVLLLCKEAGHKVEGEQGEIVIDGVVGHRDAIIDGVSVDVKSASKFGFKKFEQGTLFEDDPFGYIGQISSYAKADGKDEAAFLAVNKESGELCLLPVHAIDMINPVDRIAHLRKVLSSKEAPINKCYEPIPNGKSGNTTLNKNCTYCPHKFKCWTEANNGKGLRSFRYSDGIRHFVNVVEEPRVEEVKASPLLELDKPSDVD